MTSSNTTTSNKKRLAKNTLLLYIRTIIVMCVSLFTSREVLRILGVEDYGIYNVVGGFVTMFSLISGSLSSAISRFITYELGKKEDQKLNEVFCTSVNIQIILSVIVIIAAEIFGVWFLNTQMNIPEPRMEVANWLLQFSIITFVVNLISIPYNASIIAHEDMNVFAYISLLEAGLKLVILYLLIISPFDKLASYGFYLVLVSLLIRLIYGIYCKRRYQECHYRVIVDKLIMKKMFHYAGWNVVGASPYMFNTNGIDLISNIFFGVHVNAARGIALQASNAVRQFVYNFTTALNPQIIKTYAAGEREECFSTVNMGAKFSSYMMLFFAVPLIIDADCVLYLWLNTVTEHTSLFFRLSMISIIMEMPCTTLATLAISTDNVRKYFIWMGVWSGLIFPISFLCFYLGAPAFTSYVVYIIMYFLMIFLRLILLRETVQFPIARFFSQVLFPIFRVMIFAFSMPLLVWYFLDESFVRLVMITIVSSLSIVIGVYFMGLLPNEKNTIVRMIRSKILKR